MNETRIPPSREVQQHEDRQKHTQWDTSARACALVFLYSFAGWVAAAGLWWLGGKL